LNIPCHGAPNSIQIWKGSINIVSREKNLLFWPPNHDLIIGLTWSMIQDQISSSHMDFQFILKCMRWFNGIVKTAFRLIIKPKNNFCLRPSTKLMASGIGMTILLPPLPLNEVDGLRHWNDNSPPSPPSLLSLRQFVIFSNFFSKLFFKHFFELFFRTFF
jgi:hypothetical protein